MSRTLWIYGFALAIRCITSWTYAHWFHPDEWCQTLEHANLIAHGFGFHSQETGLHLRNLSWPALLALLLKVVHAVSPQGIGLRIWSVHFLCGLLDLGILWGWMQLAPGLIKAPRRDPLLPSIKLWSLALLLLPWYTLYSSINPRAEHLSEIAFWIALGCFANQFWILTGIASVAIFAFRYPSILLSIGIGSSILLQAVQGKSFSRIYRFCLGIVFGLILFGISDWLFYGRPWESFWMYLQYNIFTGSGTQAFGEQGISSYSEIFLWNWTTYRLLAPLGILLFFAGVYGFWKGLQQAQNWAICLALYLIAHLLVPHKEARFMAPIETLTRWSAFTGCLALYFSLTSCLDSLQLRRFKKAAVTILWFFIIINGFIFLHHLRGDLWKDLGTYRELSTHLKHHPNTCGILTTRFVNSLLLPFQDSLSFPQPAVASFQSNLNHLTYEATKDSDLFWIEHPPNCRPQDSILLHVHEAQTQWNQEGCQLLRSGALQFVPTSFWNLAIQHRLAKGSWYACPPTIVHHFRSQKTQHQYSHQFGKQKELPAYGISATELEKIGRQTSPPPVDAVLPSIIPSAHLRD